MAKLFKRGRVWFAWVPKRGGGTRRVSTLCTDKRAAESVLATLEREAVDPAYAAANKATTQRVLDEYYRSRERLGRSAGTLHHVRVKAGALVGLLPARAADISHPLMLGYVDKRLVEGAMRTTIKKELRVLKAALNLAKRNGLYAGDPASVIPELDDDYRPRSRALSPEEFMALRRELTPGRAAHVTFIVATGARWSESLRATGFDLGAGPNIHLRGTKTLGADRRVPRVFDILIHWAHENAYHQGAGPAFAPWASVRRDLAVACKHAGIPSVTPNDLRRTFGTWLRQMGVEPNHIAVAMGHADGRMVERTYGRLTTEALGKLLERCVGGELLMGAIADDSVASGASGATVESSVATEKTSALAGAQGRNRTADTGIFSPSVQNTEYASKQAVMAAGRAGCDDTWGANGLSFPLREATDALLGLALDAGRVIS